MWSVTPTLCFGSKTVVDFSKAFCCDPVLRVAQIRTREMKFLKRTWRASSRYPYTWTTIFHVLKPTSSSYRAGGCDAYLTVDVKCFTKRRSFVHRVHAGKYAEFNGFPPCFLELLRPSVEKKSIMAIKRAWHLFPGLDGYKKNMESKLIHAKKYTRFFKVFLKKCVVGDLPLCRRGESAKSNWRASSSVSTPAVANTSSASCCTHHAQVSISRVTRAIEKKCYLVNIWIFEANNFCRWRLEQHIRLFFVIACSFQYLAYHNRFPAVLHLHRGAVRVQFSFRCHKQAFAIFFSCIKQFSQRGSIIYSSSFQNCQKKTRTRSK